MTAKAKVKSNKANEDIMKMLNSNGVEAKNLSDREFVPYWIDTTSAAFNWIIGNSFDNGIPGTKICLFAGENSSGKSLMCDVILGSNIKQYEGISMRVDVEDSAGHSFTAKVVGDKEIASQIQIIAPPEKPKKKEEKIITIEKLTQILYKIIDFQMAKKKEDRNKIVVVIDSVSQLSSVKEILDADKGNNTKDMTSQQELRKTFRIIGQRLRGSNVTVVGIGHVTANIGVMFGPKKVVSAKGSGFGYASSLIIMTKKVKEITNSNGLVVGLRIKVETSKNRMEFKGRNCWVTFYFNKGIDRYGGLPELLVQYGVFKSSGKLDVNGLLSTTNTLSWYDKETDKTHEFKVSKFKRFIKEHPEGEEYLLQRWEEELNEIYENAMTDEDEELLLAEGDYEEETVEDEDIIEQISEDEDGEKKDE